MDRKRRGGALDGIPESKRPTRGAGTSAAATGRAGAAGRGAGGAAAGRGAAGGVGGAAGAAAAAAEPKPEETWDDIAERSGLTPDDVLNRCVCCAC
jgi:hypothetical protein